LNYKIKTVTSTQVKAEFVYKGRNEVHGLKNQHFKRKTHHKDLKFNPLPVFGV